jgi:hypothetical protein
MPFLPTHTGSGIERDADPEISGGAASVGGVVIIQRADASDGWNIQFSSDNGKNGGGAGCRSGPRGSPLSRINYDQAHQARVVGRPDAVGR